MIQEIADRVSYMEKRSESGWNHMRIFKNYNKESNSMNFSHKEDGNVLVVTLEGQNLDAQDVPEFKNAMMGLIDSSAKKHVVLELNSLEFIDSSGLGSLLSVLRHLNSQGGDLRLTKMNSQVRAMFELVRMHKLFEIFHDTDEAMNSFHNN